jgi:hypothetical protein
MRCHRCQTEIWVNTAGFCVRCVLLILEEWLLKREETANT